MVELMIDLRMGVWLYLCIDSLLVYISVLNRRCLPRFDTLARKSFLIIYINLALLQIPSNFRPLVFRKVSPFCRNKKFGHR